MTRCGRWGASYLRSRPPNTHSTRLEPYSTMPARARGISQNSRCPARNLSLLQAAQLQPNRRFLLEEDGRSPPPWFGHPTGWSVLYCSSCRCLRLLLALFRTTFHPRDSVASPRLRCIPRDCVASSTFASLTLRPRLCVLARLRCISYDCFESRLCSQSGIVTVQSISFATGRFVSGPSSMYKAAMYLR